MKKRKYPKRKLECHVCKAPVTHVVLIELRAKPGPPLKEDNVLRVVCEEHSKDNRFDTWVPLAAFNYLCDDWKRQTGVILNKRYCTIAIKPFKKK